ncbi:MAG: hypothetical protein ACREOG_20955, partial [Gemmatimonadaceae bacterium]
ERRITMGLSEHDIRRWPHLGGWYLDPRSGHRIRTGDGLDLGEGVSLGDGVTFGDGVTLGDGISVGDGVVIGDGATGAIAQSSPARSTSATE